MRKQKIRATANLIIAQMMRESVVQIPNVSTLLAVCTFLYSDAQGSNRLLSHAKAKDSRYRKFNYRTNDARISGSDS
jgi:hypothetical protein